MNAVSVKRIIDDTSLGKKNRSNRGFKFAKKIKKKKNSVYADK